MADSDDANTAYIIEGGTAGKQRLNLLAEVFRPSTQRFIANAGLAAGHVALDLGCGGGHVTRDMAGVVGDAGHAIGVDFDPAVVALADRDAKRTGITNIEFRVGDAFELEGGPFDFAYARMLLSHVTDPAAVLGRLVGVVHPGGVIAVEDIDMSGVFAHPANGAVTRHVELYVAAARQRGADPMVAQRLPALLAAARLHDVRWEIVQLMHRDGPHKGMTRVTMQRIAPAVLQHGLATAEELDDVDDRLAAATADPDTFIALPRVVQAWGTVPDRPCPD